MTERNYGYIAIRISQGHSGKDDGKSSGERTNEFNGLEYDILLKLKDKILTGYIYIYIYIYKPKILNRHHYHI